jgi:hypothetical protein
VTPEHVSDERSPEGPPNAADLSARGAVLASVLLLAVVVSFTKVSDYDSWWHLRLGQEVMESGQLKQPDRFSYTAAGSPQYSGEWLADVSFYLAHAAGGFVGLNILKSAIVVGTVLLLFAFFHAARPREADRLWWIAAGVSVALVLFALRFRLYLRPYIFSYLFVALFLYLLARRREGAPLAAILIPAQIVWANTSKGAFFGPLLVALFLVGDLLGGRRDRRLVSLLGAVLVATSINPELWDVYLSPLSRLLAGGQRSMAYSLGEHQPLSPELLWGHGLGYTFAFQALFLGGLAHLVLGRGWSRTTHLLLFVVFAIPAVLMVRLTTFFSLAASVLTFLLLCGLLARLPRRVQARAPLLHGFVALLLAGCALQATRSEMFEMGVGPRRDTYPAGALDFLAANQVEGRIFNSYSIGGYLIWNAPEMQVYIDGRGHHLYDPKAMERYFQALEDAEAWGQEKQRWGFSVAVLEYDIRDGGKHFPLHLTHDEDWALVYWDTRSAVYLERIERHLPVIQRAEYRVTRPALNDFSYLMTSTRSPVELQELVQQIDREIAYQSENQEPRLAKASLLLNYGNARGRQVGFDELRHCLQLAPDLAMEHETMAVLLMRHGEASRARAEAEVTLRMDPTSALARQVLDELDGVTPTP